MRQTLQTLFGFDLSTGQKWIIAFAVILALLALLGLFARQIKGGRLRMKGQGGGRARLPRLGVVDTHDLDRQRQLVLIRRDNVEHLIMIGGPSDVVVETNIVRGGQRAQGPADAGLPERPLAMEPPPAEPPSRAEAEPRRLPPPPIAVMPEPLPPLPTKANPPPPAPRATPVPPPADLGLAVAAAATGAAVLAGTARTPLPSSPAPNFARDHSPAPAVSAAELDDMARQLEEALKRPHSTVRAAQAPVQPADDVVIDTPKPIEPSPIAAAPVPLSVPPAILSAPPADVLAPIPAPMPPPIPVSAPPPMPSPPAPPVMVGQPMPAPLDVEAELELALGLKPERVVPRPSEAAPAPYAPPIMPIPTAAPEEPAPVRTEAPALEREAEPADAIDEDSGLFDAPDEVQNDSPQSSEPVFEPEAAFELEPAPEPLADPELPPPPPPAPEPKPAAIDPFSVDAIEAEFARLLGRDPKPKG